MNRFVQFQNHWAIGITIAALTFGLSHLPGWSQSHSQRPAPYPKLTLVLTDKASPGSDFGQFRDRLRQAVQKQDAGFIKQVMAPGIKLTFGRPFPISQLNLENPKAPVWQNLERTLTPGCAPMPPIQKTDPVTWACPTVFIALGVVKHIDPFEQIFIVGKDVIIRRQPSIQSTPVTIVSHQVVKLDQIGMGQLTETQRNAIDSPTGWTPILLPNSQRGFVSGRYAYAPLGYRALFQKVKGQWQMQALIAGD
jgi:hypothetical protein